MAQHAHVRQKKLTDMSQQTNSCPNDVASLTGLDEQTTLLQSMLDMQQLQENFQALKVSARL